MLPREPANSDNFHSYRPLQEVAVAQVPLPGGGALVAIRGKRTIIMRSYDVTLSEHSLTNQIIVDYGSTSVRRSDSMQHEYAKGRAKQLTEKYNVPVDVVATKEQFYSNETLRKTAKEGIYFVCEEACTDMVEVTEYMIRFNKLKYQLANAGRLEKAAENASKLSSVIENIRANYSSDHSGKTPSLHKIAAILNEKKIDTPGGKGKWIAVTVKKILDRSVNHSEERMK